MKNEIDKARAVLRAGGVLLYPTDTVWGIGCDAANAQAVERIYRIKQRHESKALICLVSDLEMLRRHVEVPQAALDHLSDSQRPTTIIYRHPKGVAKNLLAQDDTLAIRIAGDTFCQELIAAFGGPIVSTSANISGEPAPGTFADLSDSIRNAVDHIVNWGQDKPAGSPSTIIKLDSNGEAHILRP